MKWPREKPPEGYYWVALLRHKETGWIPYPEGFRTDPEVRSKFGRRLCHRWEALFELRRASEATVSKDSSNPAGPS